MVESRSLCIFFSKFSINERLGDQTIAENRQTLGLERVGYLNFVRHRPYGGSEGTLWWPCPPAKIVRHSTEGHPLAGAPGRPTYTEGHPRCNAP